MTAKTWTIFAQLAAGMILFGSATPVSKIVTEAFPVFTASALRVSLSTVVLFPFVLGELRVLRNLCLGDWIRIILIALFGMFGFTVALLYGMKYVSGVVGSIVMSTTPAVTALAAVLFLNEQLTKRRIAAVAFAIVGVLLVNAAGAGFTGASLGTLILGTALVFGAVCCEVCYSLIGKAVGQRISPLMTVFLAGLLSLPLFAPFAFMEWRADALTNKPPQDWFWMAWWSLGALALGSALWYKGLTQADGAFAAAFMGLMPVSALVLSYLILGESFYWVHAVGFSCVFIGVLIIIGEHRQAAKAN